jgi:hypothetical protein
MTMKTKNMKMKKATTLRALGAVAALAATGAAQAHTGHGTESLFAGLAHPLGLDHLLAMVGVGTWSAVALPAGRRVAGPATFLAALLAGAVAGAAGLALPLTETAIAASVLLFGLMLAFARQVPVGAGLALTADTRDSGWARFKRAFGRGILYSAPYLMKFLSIAGTAAMFLVGGGILVHSIPALHHLIQPYTHGGWGVLWENLFNAGVGVVAGAVILAVVTAVQRLRGKRHAA